MDTREEGDVDGDLKQSPQKRNANRNRMVLWQDRIIPYEFDPGLPSKKKKHLVDKTTHSEIESDCFTECKSRNESITIFEVGLLSRLDV